MKKRSILRWMIFFMVVANTLVTISMNVAIVSMVNFHEDVKDSELNEIVCPNTTLFLKNLSIIENKQQIPAEYQETTYEWSMKERNMVLGGYYKINYITILPAGILAQKYGSKKVSGYSQFIASCMSSIIPILAGYGPVVVTWIRALQGALSFMAVPAGMYVTIANWSPPQERGVFAASAIVGSGVGQTLGDICFGYIARCLGWQYVFYVTSIFGVIWAVSWYMLVHEYPSDHPTITVEEKNYIQTSLMHTNKLKHDIPWKDIITSVPFITSVFASNASIWFFVMLTTYTPIYLKSMYGLSSNEIGIISGSCLFLTTVLALAVGYFIDIFMKQKILPISALRKICSFTGCMVSCVPLTLIVFLKCDINMVLICLLLVSILKGFSMHGAAMGVVDMSPKFCGILEGISGTTSSILSFIFSSIITYCSGVLNYEDLWKFVFFFTASYSILAHSIYMIFGSSKIQVWNFMNPVEEQAVEM